jgi:hypothetical protein
MPHDKTAKAAKATMTLVLEQISAAEAQRGPGSAAGN